MGRFTMSRLSVLPSVPVDDSGNSLKLDVENEINSVEFKRPLKICGLKMCKNRSEFG